MKRKSEKIAQMILDNALQWTRGGGNYKTLECEIINIVDAVIGKCEPICSLCGKKIKEEKSEK